VCICMFAGEKGGEEMSEKRQTRSIRLCLEGCYSEKGRRSEVAWELESAKR